MWTRELTCFHFSVCQKFLSSLTLCNTLLFARSTQLVFSIHLQQRFSSFSPWACGQPLYAYRQKLCWRIQACLIADIVAGTAACLKVADVGGDSAPCSAAGLRVSNKGPISYWFSVQSDQVKHSFFAKFYVDTQRILAYVNMFIFYSPDLWHRVAL